MSQQPNRRRVPVISEFMTRNPCTTDHDLSVKDAQERMYMNKIRHLLVLKDGELAGIVSTRDLDVLALTKSFDPEKDMVSSVMISDPFTCAPDTPIDEVAKKMEGGRYGCAVITERNVPVGIFTTVDGLRAIRQMIAGVPVEAEKPAEHEPPEPGERKKKISHTRTSSALDGTKTKTFTPS